MLNTSKTQITGELVVERSAQALEELSVTGNHLATYATHAIGHSGGTRPLVVRQAGISCGAIGIAAALRNGLGLARVKTRNGLGWHQ